MMTMATIKGMTKYYLSVFDADGNEVRDASNTEYDNINDAIADKLSWLQEGYDAEVCTK